MFPYLIRSGNGSILINSLEIICFDFLIVSGALLKANKLRKGIAPIAIGIPSSPHSTHKNIIFVRLRSFRLWVLGF